MPRQKPTSKAERDAAWRKMVGAADAAGVIARGMIAEPISGWAGLLAAPGGPEKMAAATNKTQEWLTQPFTEAGAEALGKVGETLAPVAEYLEKPAEYGYEKGGVAGGMLGKLAPEVAFTVLPGGFALRKLAQARRAKGLLNPVVPAGKQRGFVVYESDFADPRRQGLLDTNKLNEAKKMFKDNATPAEIKLTTGWERDAQGKWFLERSDADAKLRLEDFYAQKKAEYEGLVNAGEFGPDPSNIPSLPRWISTQPEPTVGELLNHPEYFKYFPEDRNVRVGRLSGNKNSGLWEPRTQATTPKGRAKAQKKNPNAIHLEDRLWQRRNRVRDTTDETKAKYGPIPIAAAGGEAGIDPLGVFMHELRHERDFQRGIPMDDPVVPRGRNPDQAYYEQWIEDVARAGQKRSMMSQADIESVPFSEMLDYHKTPERWIMPPGLRLAPDMKNPKAGWTPDNDLDFTDLDFTPKPKRSMAPLDRPKPEAPWMSHRELATGRRETPVAERGMLDIPGRPATLGGLAEDMRALRGGGMVPKPKAAKKAITRNPETPPPNPWGHRRREYAAPPTAAEIRANPEVGRQYIRQYADPAKEYPPSGPPVWMRDPNKNKYYWGKQQTEPEQVLNVLREIGRKQIAAKSPEYQPYFDISKREHIPEGTYGLFDDTMKVAMPKGKGKTLAKTTKKYQKLADTKAGRDALWEGYARGKVQPGAKDWYAMKQLFDEFIRELGPEEGIKQFDERFAKSMAATTGGSDPTANLLSSAYGNYAQTNKLPIRIPSHQLPAPVGGRFISGNMGMFDDLYNQGEPLTAVDHPKRYNFRGNFLGNLKNATIDEQMMSAYNRGWKGTGKPPLAPQGPSYGIYEKVPYEIAAKEGIPVANFQDVTWKGLKDIKDEAKFYSKKKNKGKTFVPDEAIPMIEHINRMIHRTAAVTGDSPEEVLRGYIRGNRPMYGAGAGLLGTEGLLSEKENER